MTGWQPIETAPKDGSVVLISDTEHITMAFWQDERGRTLIAAESPYWEPFDHSSWVRAELTDITDDWFEPTHWMPLPELPK